MAATTTLATALNTIDRRALSRAVLDACERPLTCGRSTTGRCAICAAGAQLDRAIGVLAALAYDAEQRAEPTKLYGGLR